MQGSSLSEAIILEEESDVHVENIDQNCSGLQKGGLVNITMMLVNEEGQYMA